MEEAQAEIIPPEVAAVQVPLSANKILSEGVQVTKATVSVSGEIQVVTTSLCFILGEYKILDNQCQLVSCYNLLPPLLINFVS